MGQSRYTPNPRKYFKTNFVDLIEELIPDIYADEDINLSGTGLNPLSEVINTHIQVANNIVDIIPLSGVANTQTSSLGSIDGIAQYFVKQNKLTNITPYLFESKILLPLGVSISDYDTSGEFSNYLSGTLLPSIIPPTPSDDSDLVANITTLSALTGDNNTSSVHNYLVDALGWFYFLNTPAGVGFDYSPSTYVLESLNTLYLGNKLETVDGIKGLTEYLWRNNVPGSFDGYLPSNFVSGESDGIVDSSAGILPLYTSGTQRLEALKTLIDVIYSPLYLDEQDFTVKDAFTSYIDSTLLLEDQKSQGPHRKFVNLLGFQYADISDEVENVGLIYDIENVREEHLQYIADLIGFKLRGRSPSKWRQQLRSAVDLYKKSGTLESIQTAVNTLIVDSVLDVSGKVQELWESYLPHLIWYALGTESPLFKDLNTWTQGLAEEAGVFTYSTSSLEENIKMVVDTILLDLYKAFPDNFVFNGKKFVSPALWELDNNGCRVKRWALVGEAGMRPFHIHKRNSPGFLAYKQDAKNFGESKAFNAATGFGVLGDGVYMAGLDHPRGERPVYLQPEGDVSFFFNYRGRQNFPIPPFESIKYYKDCNVTADLVDLLVDKLKCFKVKESFAEDVRSYLLDNAVTDGSDLGTLNEFLMFFSSVQVPTNFNDVMLSISDYEKNLLNLWCGKSSHLFLNFKDTDFNFAKTTLEGDGKYALYEASRIGREFSPAHAILRTNLAASAEDPYGGFADTQGTYAKVDREDSPKSLYTSSAGFSNFEFSGVSMGTVGVGTNDGRGGLNTFKREDVDHPRDLLLSSTTEVAALNNVARKAHRRRNFKYLLPHEGYYDRTGFNGPVAYDAVGRANEVSELTLGYSASACKFHPIIDPISPSGVWDYCEGPDSDRTFSGVATADTFRYRGLASLGSNAKRLEVTSDVPFYVDRGQVPEIYITMHKLFQSKAYDYANEQIKDTSAFDVDDYWKNNIQSFANEAIASGYLLNSFSEYENFSFGTGLQKTHREYCTYFNKHSLGGNELDYTGGSIIAQVFGKGLYNCDFSVDGSAVSTLEGNYIASSIDTAVPISENNGSGVFSTCAVAAYGDGYASGTYIASDAGEMVIPLTGTFTFENPYNAEFRNPHILSGIEFVQTSGAPSDNQFTIFNLSKKVAGAENILTGNKVIKCKSSGGLPRLRFDLSSYGTRPNRLIRDHKFKINIKALIGEENSPVIGGGKVGVWIHTQAKSDFMWSWTKQGRWEAHRESELSQPLVLNTLSHLLTFPTSTPTVEKEYCLGNKVEDIDVANNKSLLNLKDSYFENFELEFDTRNFTDQNNSEYLDIIPMDNEVFEIFDLVHDDDTNYIVEFFFVPNNNKSKYLLLDSIGLQDVTQREHASIGTGHGLETSGIPFRPFVREDKLYLTKEQLVDVLRFYNGLARSENKVYASNIASRDSTITADYLELSGGSRLNYRINPEWTPGFTKDSSHNNYTNLEFEN